VRTEPVGDLGVVVVWYDLMGFEVKPPIAVRHLTLLRAARLGCSRVEPADARSRDYSPTYSRIRSVPLLGPFAHRAWKSAYFVVTRRRQACLLAPPQHGGARLPTLTPRKIAR